MRKFLSVLTAFSLTFVLSCQKQAQKPQDQQTQERKVVVSLYRVKSEDVPIEYSTKGYFEGEKDVILRPLVSGRVLNLFVEEGDFVRSGQALLKIDPADYENTLRQFEAQLAQARASYENQRAIAERRRFLFERELIAREEYE
ncbi:MAG: biotin/lipoyl-binding protein, partial [Aquificota bacterium]